MTEDVKEVTDVKNVDTVENPETPETPKKTKKPKKESKPLPTESVENPFEFSEEEIDDAQISEVSKKDMKEAIEFLENSEVSDRLSEPTDTVCVVVLDSPDILTSLDISVAQSFLFLWCDPENIAGIVELNFFTRKLKERGILAESTVIDLIKAGYPHMSLENKRIQHLKIVDTWFKTLELIGAKVIKIVDI